MRAYQQKMQHQRGAVLFVMIMILLALTIVTFMATNIGKTDARISNAYTEQSKAFIRGEEMLARLRYALEQIPLPEGVALNGNATTARPIWMTGNLANDLSATSKDGEPDFTNPAFAEANGENWNKTNTALSCENIADWMKNYTALSGATNAGKFEPLDCSVLDPYGKTRTVIELVNRKQNEGDIDDLRDTYYYRITIRAKGDNSGESLVQGVTGIQYN